MNNFFPYKVDLPFSDKSIFYRELNTQEQLNLAKSNLIHPNRRETHSDYFDSVFSIVRNCTKKIDDLDDINIVDFIFFLAKIRLVSISNIVELNINSDSEEFKNTKINVDINFFIEKLYTITTRLMENNILKNQNIEIELGWPSIDDIKIFSMLLGEEFNDLDKVQSAMPLFVKTIKIMNRDINLNSLNYDEKKHLYGTLPFSVSSAVQEKVIDVISDLKEEDIFGFPKYIFYKFDFFNLVFVDMIKLLFLFNLTKIYQDIYILSKRNMSEEYILTLSPTERKIYLSYENNSEEKKNPEPEITGIDEEESDVQKLQREFGEI